MIKNKINPAFHFQFLILLLLCVLSCEQLITILGIVACNVTFLIYHNNDLFLFLRSCKKLSFLYFTISIIISMLTLDMNFVIILWVKLTLITKNIVYYLDCQDWMSLFYGLDCTLWILDYMGISSTQVAWMITSKLRNLEIYFRACQMYAKKINIYGMDFHYKSICDKIDSTKEIFRMASYIAKQKIKTIDDVMKLRLFQPNISRTNYHVENWKPLDFMLLMMLIFLLASEVII